MAGKAEAAGERVEGAQREAIREVGRLGQAFKNAGTAATTMAQKAAGVRRRIAGAAGSLGAAFGIAGGAFAIGASAKRISSVEQRTERLGVVSQRSTEEMNALRDEIYEVANAPDIRIDPSQLLTGVEAIFEKTGDLDFARDNLRLIAEAIQGSGGTGEAVGRLVAEFKKLDITTSGGVAKAFNTLFVVGNMGSFTLGDMSAEGEKLVSSFVRLGYSGQGAVKQMGALAQVAKSVSGSAPEAVSAVEGFLSAFTDAAKLEKIESELGVQVRLDDGSFRDVSKIATELIAAVGGDIVQLSEIFDETGLRVVGGLASKKGQELYRQSLDVAPTGNEITEAADRIAQTTEAKAQDIRTSFEAQLVKHFTGPLRGVATTLAEFQGELVAAVGAGFLLTGAFRAVKGAVGLVAATRGAKAVGDAGDAAEAVGDADFDGDPGEGKGKRGGKGKGKGPVARVNQMRVDTMRVSRMIGGRGDKRGGAGAGVGAGAAAGVGAGAGAGAAKAGGAGAKLAGVGAAFRGGRGAGGAGVAAGVIGAVGLFEAIRSGASTEEIATEAGGVAGGIAGAVAGAAVGTAILPVVGTVIGGVIGGVGGDAIGRGVVDAFGGFQDRLESATPASGVHPRVARREELLARQVDLEPAPIAGVAPGAAPRGNVRYQSRVSIGTINVSSNASDPKQVAIEVADEVERRQRERGLRIEDGVSADGPSEIIF